MEGYVVCRIEELGLHTLYLTDRDLYAEAAMRGDVPNWASNPLGDTTVTPIARRKL
jgi:hypothetical protein